VPLLLARLDELQGQPHEAIPHYLQALEKGEARPSVIRRLLELLLEWRDYSRAEEALNLYGQHQALTPELLRQATEVALGNQNNRLALERARLAAPLPARDYRAYLWRAGVEQRAEALKDADEHLRTAAQLAEYVPAIWIARAGLLAASDRSGEAGALLAEARAQLPADAVPFTVARCYEALRQPAEADAAYRQALAAQPNDVALLAAAADFQRRAGHEARAAALWRHLLAPQCEAPLDLAVRARRQLAVLLAGAAPVEALGLLDSNRRALGATVADERIRLFVLGQSAEERNTSLTQFRDSLGRQPFTADEQVLLARLYEAAGKLDQAREELAQVVALEGQAPEYLAPLIRILIRTDELAEAEAYLSRLEKREPGSERAHSLHADLQKARVASSPIP
jgi:Tfp pilus assembly protein PilF